MRQGRTGRGDSDLGTLLLDPVEDGLERRIAKATDHPPLLIAFVPGTQPLGAVVEGVTERFVNALKRVTACHEDLS